jgi:hypothetical protein
MPCRVVLITERKESFDELDKVIRDAARRLGTRPVIRHVHGDMENRGNSVTKEIEELPCRHADCDHIIVIATHAALLRSDFSGFAGWRIIIDEVPGFLDFEEKLTHLDAAYFARYYHLEPVSDQWCAVTLTDAGHDLSVADVRADQSHSHLGVFHARVSEASRVGAMRHVLCNLPDWAAMTNRKVKWCWASVFSLRQLEAFERIELLGNRFRSDIGSKLTQFFDGDGVEWVALPPLGLVRHFSHRQVEINFFSERPAARSWFEAADGQRVLAEIGKYLLGVLPKNNSIWTTNGTSSHQCPPPKQLLGLSEADYLTPKQAGTNRFQAISHAAVIYAAKPCPNLRGLLIALDIDPDMWTRSVEFEAILQFVTRTSIRDPNNATPVRLWVFDGAQALYLKEYFDGLPHVTSTVSKVALPLDIRAKQSGGRPAISRTPVEQAVWDAERRRKDAERKRRMRRVRGSKDGGATGVEM